MDDNSEIVLKKLCCTCLSKNRKLFQLCRLADGVNNLYLLLSYDSEAYREGFYKDTTNLFICWECKATMRRFTNFRQQACTVQRQLSCIVDRQMDINSVDTSYSNLTVFHKENYDCIITSNTSETPDLTDNFIDCGPITDIKSEDDESEDIPLSELHNNFTFDYEIKDTPSPFGGSDTKPRLKKCAENDGEKQKSYKKKKKTKIKDKNGVIIDKEYYKTVEMSEEEMYESREKRKMASIFIEAEWKCESCIDIFKTQNDLELHNSTLHVEREQHVQCPVCLSFVRPARVPAHSSAHRRALQCVACAQRAHTTREMRAHLRTHSPGSQDHKVKRKTPQVMNPGSKPRRNQAMTDKRTPYGYLCSECNKYFDNKNQRWKHVQRHHREGFACEACGKRFAFRNNLARHALLHQGPPPREECPVCRKMVRSDLVKAHARIHVARERHSCAACQKHFVSRASYEHHLKYTQAHAARDILKYKCSMCDKGYRSRGELRDHVNYQHMGKTQHKCPICGKALATRRCITRHVRRAHHGLKESARDKVCQQCGKAFRDKKGLREHEFIHTGERPLSCEICGCTFRQSASLYTHRKRVHKIYPQRKSVQLDTEALAS